MEPALPKAQLEIRGTAVPPRAVRAGLPKRGIPSCMAKGTADFQYSAYTWVFYFKWCEIRITLFPRPTQGIKLIIPLLSKITDFWPCYIMQVFYAHRRPL